MALYDWVYVCACLRLSLGSSSGRLFGRAGFYFESTLVMGWGVNVINIVNRCYICRNQVRYRMCLEGARGRTEERGTAWNCCRRAKCVECFASMFPLLSLTVYSMVLSMMRGYDVHFVLASGVDSPRVG